jgi:hypothetical protein
MEEREYQGHIYRRNAPSEPWQMVGPSQQQAPAPSGGPIYGAPKLPDPGEAERLQLARNADARAQQDQARQAAMAPIQQQAAVADLENKGKLQESERTATFLATRVAGGVKKLAEIGPQGGPTLGTEAAGMFGKWGNYATPELRQRTINAQLDVLDAALTLGTGAAYNKEQLESYRQSYFPQVGDQPGTIADKAERLRVLLEAAKVKAGSGAPQIDEALASGMGFSGTGVGQGGGSRKSEIATGEQRRYTTDTDKAFAAAAQELFANGASREQMDALAAKYGAPAFGADLDAAIRQRQTGRGVVTFNPPETGVEDLSVAQQAIGRASASPGGAALWGGLNGITAGGLDEIGGGIDAIVSGRPFGEAIAEANLKKAIVADTNPGAYLAGNVAGGVLGAVGVQGALARAGGALAPRVLAPNALAADAAFGATSGALENNENRLAGAGVGLIAGPVGGVAGRAIARGAGRIVAPTGGSAKPLYEAGVRPTPGQRAGGIVNATEEALGSLPIVGGAVRGARQGARDQFERGAFNEALKEIGRELPKEVKLGTAPHRIAQQAFSEAYAKARNGMRFLRDPQFDQEYQQLVGDIAAGGLEETSADRFLQIVKNQVDRRLVNGRMTGKSYKEAQSALGKRARALRNSPSGDHELAGALEDFSALLDEGARRASPPEAVAALDAADLGYAKLVRIEEAAKGAGEAGRFTPNQFDRAVQNAAGGRAARSKAYLRGDALMQEYATAGRQLMDRVPNSGTADRQMLAGAMVGTTGGLISPAVAAAPIAATLPYLPGVRGVTNALMAPRESQSLNSVGNALLGLSGPAGAAGRTGALQTRR